MQESSTPPQTLRHSLDTSIAAVRSLQESSSALQSDQSALLESLHRLRMTALNSLEAVHFDCDSEVSCLRTLLHKEMSASRAELGECSLSVRRLGGLDKEKEALQWTEGFVARTEQCLFDGKSPSKSPLYLGFVVDVAVMHYF